MDRRVMRNLRGRFAAVLLAAGGALAVAGAAQAIEQKIVYIQCTKDGKVSHGSGVIVSSQGHVLTARHVVPDGSRCAGSIGVADEFDLRRLNIQPQDAVGFDARLLKFARADDYEFAGYCPLNQLEVRKKIFVAGFPGRTETGAPSYREGILSTVSLNSSGVIETDGQTVGGMSGGPVFSQNLKGLVGIVSGAQFSSDGSVSYYGILPVASFATLLSLTPSKTPCYSKSRLFDMEHPETGAPLDIWKSGQQPLDLQVDEADGFCHISGVFGEFNDPSDQVYIEVDEGRFFLSGENFNGGEHGAWATCVRYNG